MDSLSQRNESKQIEKETKRHKVTLALTITVCVIAAAALFIYIVNGFINKVYNSYEVIKTTERQDSNSVRYEACGGILLKYSRDGASGIGSDGEIKWNGSYEMNNPTASDCGEYVIIGDIGGKEAYVYNGKDSGRLIEEVNPITQVAVANQGVAAIVVETAESNEIHIYNPYGSTELLFNIPTNVKEDGYPIEISLSPDGKKLVTSYVGLSNGVIQSRVTFYNLGEVGKNNMKNYIVGGIDMEQELCPKIEFIDNDTICIYGENSFRIYSMPEVPEEVYSEVFEKEIKSVMHNDRYLGFILGSAGGEEKSVLHIYDLNGKNILKKNLDFDYDEVKFTNNEIIFLSDLSCVMMRFNGEVKWDYSFNKNVEYLFAAGGKNQFIIIDDTNIQQIKLSEADKN